MKTISRTKKVITRLYSKGLVCLVIDTYRYFLPRRLDYYTKLQSMIQSGTGLEVGGPSRIFSRRGSIPVYPIAEKIDNCNFGIQTVWEGTIADGDNFTFNKGKPPGRQYVTEASNLQSIENSSYDFVLSSECIEHLANPLQGLSEWIRVVKHNGLLLLVIPHKDRTFDHRRPVTTLQHLIEDFNNQTDESDMTHLDEILEFHDLSKDPGAGDLRSFQARSRRNIENRCLHHHVFDTPLAVEMVHHMGLQILAVEHFHPHQIVVIAKKVNSDQLLNNQQYRGNDAVTNLHSPFPSDRLSTMC